MSYYLPLAGFAFLSGLFCLGFGWMRRRVANELSDSDLIDVGEITETGTVSLEGTVTGVGERVVAPFTHREAPIVVWAVEQWKDDANESGHWSKIGCGVETTPFRLDDGTGTVDVDIDDRVETNSPGGDEVNNGVWADDVIGQFDTFPTEAEVGTGDDLPHEIREFEQRVGLYRGDGSDSRVIELADREGERRYRENVVQIGDDAFVLGSVTAAEDATRPLSPEDVTITEREGGLSVVSNLDYDSVVGKYIRYSRLWLAGGVVLMAVAVVAAVAAFL